MDEKFISLAEAAKRSPGRPSANAVWRWCRKGVKARSGERVGLDHVRAGGKIFTSIISLEKFFSELARADRDYFSDPDPKPSRPKQPTKKQRQRSIRQAEATLKRAGI